MTKRKPSSLGKQPRKQGEVVKHHLFDPETQELLGVHCRQYYNDASKRMWWTQPNGTLGLNGRKPNTLPLYGAHHMPAVSPPGTIVVIVEGETARDALSAAQILAVGTVSGAPDAPTREALVASRLTGVIAVLWPDASTVGIEMMQRTEQQLNGVAAEILWIQFTDWPAAPELEEDAVDFIQRYGPGAARDLIAKAIVQCSALPSGLDEPQATTQVQHGYGEAAPRQSQATQLVELASVAEFFHAPGGEPHVTLQVGDHRETWPVRSSGLRLWLRREFYRATGKAPSSQAIQDALGVLEAQARFDGPEIPVFVRVGDGGGTLYFDLVNARWEAVAITATGWRVVADPPVRFVRAHGMLPLSTPMPGGNVAWLRRFVNVDRKTDFVLYASYIVAALRPRGPYPVLILTGEQGSAKSTAERVARELIDPNVAPLRSEAREVRDLMIAARNGWMVALDNLSMLSGWMSDAICRLATGGGFATRTLYTDTDEILIDAMRPVALNGIANPASHGDLLDRAVILTAPVIPDEKRQREDQFWAAFAAAKPRLLGAFLDVIVHAVKTLPELELPPLPRMADFAAWSIAATPPIGWTPETFLEAYRENRGEAHQQVLEASLIGALVDQLVTTSDWKGTSTDLLAVLNDRSTEALRRQKGWPQSPRAASGLLRRIAPSLRANGIEVEFIRQGRSRSRLILITRNKKDETVRPHPTVRSVRPKIPPPADKADRADAKSMADGRVPLVSGPHPLESHPVPPVPQKAVVLLRTLLRAKPWPRMAAIRKGWDKGISGVVMDRAAQVLGVVETGEGDGVIWALRRRSPDA